MKNLWAKAFLFLGLSWALGAMEDKKVPAWSEPPGIEFNLKDLSIISYKDFLTLTGRSDNDLKSDMYIAQGNEVVYFLKGCDYFDVSQKETFFNSYRAFTEVFAYNVSQGINFPYVPHTFILRLDKDYGELKYGQCFVASRFVEGAQTFHSLLKNGSFIPKISYKILEMGNILRVILGMRDTHIGNIMLDSGNTPVFIDHESLFQEKDLTVLLADSKAHFGGIKITLANFWSALKIGEIGESWSSLKRGFLSSNTNSCFDPKVTQDLKNPFFWKSVLQETFIQLKLPEEDIPKFLGHFVDKQEESIEDFSKQIADNAQRILG